MDKLGVFHVNQASIFYVLNVFLSAGCFDIKFTRQCFENAC